MARETKVGLLVGLGFIVCFAVILSRRSSPEPADAQLAFNPFTPAPSLHAPATPPSARESLSVSRNSPPVSRNSPRPLPEDSPADPARAANPRPQEDFDPGLVERNAAALVEQGEFEAQPPRLTSAGSNPSAGERRSLRELLDRATTQGPRNDPPQAQPRQRKRASPPRRRLAAPAASTGDGTAYTVAPGDTLWKIAGKAYGKKSTQQLVNAIFEANRGVMKSPDDLKAGASLILPGWEGALPKPARNAARGSEAAPSQRQDDGRPPIGDESIRWYQVRPRDGYASIARRELGDVSRWREIHELNKDKFPDPDRIRDGVRIKLPPVMVALAGGEAP